RVVRFHRAQSAAVVAPDGVHDAVYCRRGQHTAPCGHGGPAAPGVRDWVVGLNGGQIKTATVVVASDSVDDPVHLRASQSLPRRRHRRLGGPGAIWTSGEFCDEDIIAAAIGSLEGAWGGGEVGGISNAGDVSVGRGV